MENTSTARPAGLRCLPWLALGATLLTASCSKKDDNLDSSTAPGAGGPSSDVVVSDKDAKKDQKDYDKLVDAWTPILQRGQAGGSLTVSNTSSAAFDQPAPGLSADDLAAHEAGELSFDKTFSNRQIAPIWVSVRCQGCHVAGGRAAAPRVAGGPPQLLFRVSGPGASSIGGPNPLPVFGLQIQPFAFTPDTVRTTSFKGSVTTTYVEQLKTLVDGTTVSLRQPSYSFSNPLPAGALFSPRTGSLAAGTGLLEAVSDADILALAQAQANAPSFGITGTPNYVWDPVAGATVLGRLGWKANTPSLVVQTAGAFNGDLGVTSTLFPIEPDGSRTVGGGVDLGDAERAAVVFYQRTLAVPALRTPTDPQVQAGRGLFMSARCAVCHVPVLRTSQRPGLPAQVANQVITPFTDLLLHDMGPGLADNRPDFLASGSEWRTAPLWGIGLSQTTSGHTNLLHDGRARNVLEAIMWHDGEAAYSRQQVEQMSAQDRAALLAFINSL